jgi:hypothetical protein
MFLNYYAAFAQVCENGITEEDEWIFLVVNNWTGNSQHEFRSVVRVSSK